MQITKGAIAVFSLLIVILFCQSANAQVVHFKPNTVWGDEIDNKFNLKLDSVQVYCVELDKRWTVKDTNRLNLDIFTTGINETAGSDIFHINAVRMRNNAIEITYAASEAGNAECAVYNTMGQELISNTVSIYNGEGTARINAQNLSDGAYIVKLQHNNRIVTRKVFLTKDNSINFAESKVVKDPVYTYNFTAFCKNRKPCELTGVQPANGDSIRFLLSPQTPYKFFAASIEYKIDSMYVEVYSYISPDSKTYYEYINVNKEWGYCYEGEDEFINSGCYKMDSNHYVMRIGNKCQSFYDINLDFKIEDNYITNITATLGYWDGSIINHTSGYYARIILKEGKFIDSNSSLTVDLGEEELKKNAIDAVYSDESHDQSSFWRTHSKGTHTYWDNAHWKLVLYYW